MFPFQSANELYTEFSLIMFAYSLLGFTDLNQDSRLRFDIGWISIAIFGFNLVVIVVYLIKGIMNSLTLSVKCFCYSYGCWKPEEQKKT